MLPIQYTINPLTQRNIVVGGRVYNKLIRKGVIEDPNKENIDPNPVVHTTPVKEIEILPDPVDDVKEEEKKEIEEIEEKEETEKIDKIEKTEKIDVLKRIEEESESDEPLDRIDDAELPDKIAKAAQKVIQHHKVELEQIDNDDELYKEIQRLIREELNDL